MKLEEFLNLSDVKDGVTTPTRIEDLITLMQDEKDGKTKSAYEAARQHSAIARVIAETRNTNCLDHFIKLDGLRLINGWLNEAHAFASDTSGDFIKESITLLCGAVEKLCISNEMLISSGLLDTVKNLCDHHSTFVKEKARKLLDSWANIDPSLVQMKGEKVDAVDDSEEDKAMTKTEEDGSLFEVLNAAPKKTENSQNFVEDGKEEGSDCLQLVEAEKINAEATCSPMTTPLSPDQINLDRGAIAVIVSAGVSVSEVVTSGEGIVSTSMNDSVGDGKPGAHENTNSGKVDEKINSIAADMKIVKFTRSSIPVEVCSTATDILTAEQTMPEHGIQTNICCKDSHVYTSNEFVDGGKKAPSENNSEIGEIGHQRSLVTGSPERADPTPDALPENAASGNVVGLNSRAEEDYSKASAIQNLARDTKSSAVAETRSDFDLDYGVMDALEVARQVAKAVEMDMENDGSSENISKASGQPGSPDSSNEIDSQVRNHSAESSSKLDSSPQPSTEKKVETCSSEKMHSEPEECMQGVDQPQSLIQEVQVNANENSYAFDLNQEVPDENVEFSVNIDQKMDDKNGALTIQSLPSMPSPVVSGSSSHVDDLQLARSHGWRGSVGTKAFHQLSPHRDADPSGVFPYGHSSISGKQKLGALSVDLNLDKEGNDGNLAAAPAKSKNFGFDLNMMSDVEDAPPSSSWRLDKRISSHFNGHPSSSPLDIDLNEGLAAHSISSCPHPLGMSSSQNDVHPFFGTSFQYAGVKQDAEPVISIMGARVEVNRNDYSHGALSLSNGKSEIYSTEGAMGSYRGIGPGGSYGHPPHFAYNHTNAGAGPTMSYVSPMFRPGNTMTYMVDPRVGPLPQMVGSPSVVPHMYSQSPFFMSMAGHPLPQLPSRPDIDLNLGFMNGGNRQEGASKQLFGNNQTRFIGEHLSPSDSQQSSSLGKRKESETGWETYPYNMKHLYPPGNR